MIKKDLYIIEDNNRKKDNIITLIMITLLCLATISLIASYIFLVLMKTPNLIEKEYDLFSNLHKISFILIIIFSTINTILLFILIILSSKEDDYNKYKDYVFIAKEDIKTYKKGFNNREKKLKEEIKLLKNKLKNKKED